MKQPTTLRPTSAISGSHTGRSHCTSSPQYVTSTTPGPASRGVRAAPERRRDRGPRARVLPAAERRLQRGRRRDLPIAVVLVVLERPPIRRQHEIPAGRDVLVAVELGSVVELDRELPAETADDLAADERLQRLPGWPDAPRDLSCVHGGSIGPAAATEQGVFVPKQHQLTHTIATLRCNTSRRMSARRFRPRSRVALFLRPKAAACPVAPPLHPAGMATT